MSRTQANTLNPHPTLIRTPDQLQEAKRPEKPEATTASGRTADANEPASQPLGGVLRQLQTERAHG